MTAVPLGPRDLTRRTALLGAVALAISPVLGCEVATEPADEPLGAPSPPPEISPLDPATAVVVEAALNAVSRQLAWLEAAAAAYPGLKARSRRAMAMHVTHQGFLSGLLVTGVVASVAPSAIPSTRQGVETSAAQSFKALETRLTELAAAVPEPGVARALASIGAGTAQMAAWAGWDTPAKVAALPTEPGVLSETMRAAAQRVLAREHASLWWYGVLGARTSASRQPALFALIGEGYRTFRAQRDQLDAFLRTQGVEPVAAEPAYPLSWPTRSAPQRARAAARIEHDAAAAYSWLVAQVQVADGTTPPAQVRLWAITALRNAAIRELVGQGIPENFPGADDLADR